jgi:hypothetical protein
VKERKKEGREDKKDGGIVDILQRAKGQKNGRIGKENGREGNQGQQQQKGLQDRTGQ